MLTRLGAVLPIFLSAFLVAAVSADVIMLEDFEDNTVNYTGVTEFHDSDNDFFTIVPLNGAFNSDDGPYTGFNGSNFFGAEDIDDPDGPGFDFQTMVFNINIANFTDLTFSVMFAAGANSTGGTDGTIRYDAADGFRVTAQIDGGAVQDLLAFEALEPGGDQFNNELRQDADFNGIGDAAGFLPTATFTAFNGIAISGTGTNLVLRIEVYSDANNEEFAFDDVTIEGINTIPEPGSAALLIGVFGIAFLRRRRK